MKTERLETKVFQIEFAAWAAFVHLGALILLPLYFSWSNLFLAFGLAALTAYSMGIFHHMYLSHGSFKAHPLLANFGVLLGTLTWRGPMASPLRYVALHKVHHGFSDQDFDPHSPTHGTLHALIGWNWRFSPVFASRANYLQLTRKHAKNKWLVFLDRNNHSLQLIFALVLFTVGGLAGGISASKRLFDLETAIGWVAYGVFAKTLIVVYLGNLVDVINHKVGYRNYETKDQSTNSFIMSVVHLGGAISWHNNHHARPNYFSVKRNWWEFDLHYQLLRIFERIGLVSDIKVFNEAKPETDMKLVEFLKQRPLRTTVMILGRLGQLVLSLWLQVLVLESALPIYLKLPLILVLVFLAAVGLHNVALIGHEGTHFNLVKGKIRSALLGTFLSSIVPLHFNTGFAISHAEHHLRTNTEDDPDVRLFGEFEGWLARAFGARRKASLEYLRLTLHAAFRSNAKLTLPGLKRQELRLLARLNLLFSLTFLVAVIGLMSIIGWPFALGFSLSYTGAYFLSAIRPYLEHAGTNEEWPSKARTFSSWLLDFSFGTINYHLAHHLHPRIPAYNLPRFHRWLVQNRRVDPSAIISETDLTKLCHVVNSQPYRNHGHNRAKQNVLEAKRVIA